MKAFYIAEDSGRELANGLVLMPGQEYKVSDGEVGYGPGAFVIKLELAQKLDKLGVIQIEKSAAKAEKPAVVAAEIKQGA